MLTNHTQKNEESVDSSLVKGACLFHISLDEMKKLMQAKKQSRLQKGKDFNCFVKQFEEIDSFLETLKNNIGKIPSELRFQVAVGYSTPPYIAHWNLVDFYFKNGTLFTLTLDTYGLRTELFAILGSLRAYFPQAKHYYFDSVWGSKPIQFSADDCQNFAREQSAVLSRINPQLLYRDLATSLGKRRNFSLDDFYNNKLLQLAPLLRCMQSWTQLDTLPDRIKNLRVSQKSKNFTLFDWASKRSYQDQDGHWLNLAIKQKDRKYHADLKKFRQQKQQYFARDGLGFIFIIAKLEAILKDKKFDLVKIIENLIKQLDQVPKIRKGIIGGLLSIQSCHFVKTQLFIEKLNQLKNDTSLPNQDLITRFKEILEQYADQLLVGNSVRTYALLEQFVENLTVHINDQTLEVKETRVRPDNMHKDYKSQIVRPIT